MKVFAICKYRRLVWVGKVLREAGIEAEPALLDAANLQAAVNSAEESLVLIDMRSAPSWDAIARARASAPRPRFVLCSKLVMPDHVLSAMDCGLDGVISTRLSPDEAGQTLRQILRGERQIRFDPVPRRTFTAIQPSNTDFDGFWMFGTGQEI